MKELFLEIINENENWDRWDAEINIPIKNDFECFPWWRKSKKVWKDIMYREYIRHFIFESVEWLEGITFLSKSSWSCDDHLSDVHPTVDYFGSKWPIDTHSCKASGISVLRKMNLIETQEASKLRCFREITDSVRLQHIINDVLIVSWIHTMNFILWWLGLNTDFRTQFSFPV